VLAGHPQGRLSVDELKRAVAILICSGSEWTDRTKRMLARAPGLDIFSQSLVVRDAQGWQITEAGRALLSTIEKPVTAPPAEETSTVDEPTYSTLAPLPGTCRRQTSRGYVAVGSADGDCGKVGSHPRFLANLGGFTAVARESEYRLASDLNGINEPFPRQYLPLRL